MTARTTDEPHRAPSQLELLFDLTFVVAISRITAQLASGIADGGGAHAVAPYLQVFFAIWWAWMNFTWFASAYDNDDIAFRLLTLIQMAGVLVLAAGVPAAFNHNDYLAVTVGYVIMRSGLIAHWLRAAIEDPAHRATSIRYAVGFAGSQVAWLVRLTLAEAGLLPGNSASFVFLGLVALELSIPLWSERKGRTSWHPHHIADRYGLFAIILLGESILAASETVEAVVEHGRVSTSLIAVAVEGLLLVFALWWLYFLDPAGQRLVHNRDRALLWGFSQYGVFAALAGLGAGLQVAIERTGNQIRLSPVAVCYAVAIPVGLFLVLVWVASMPIAPRPALRPLAILTGAAIVLLLPLAANTIGVAGVLGAVAAVCASIIVATVVMHHVPLAMPRVGAPSLAGTDPGPLRPSRPAGARSRPSMIHRVAGRSTATSTRTGLSSAAWL